MYLRSRRYPAPIAGGSAEINVGRVERALSVAGGILLTARGLHKGGLGGLARALGGAALVYRGVTGHCKVYAMTGHDTARTDDAPGPVHVQTAMTVGKPRDEVFAVWRQLDLLPNFMKHLDSVRSLDDKRSEWIADVPGHLGKLQWEAEIVDEEPGRRIAWRSVAGADISNSGLVEFADAPGGNGYTQLRAEIAYRPPAGYLGATMGKWLNPAFERMVREDLRRFKQMMEAGSLKAATAG